MNKKSIPSILLSVLMAISVTACNSGNPQQQTSSQAASLKSNTTDTINSKVMNMRATDLPIDRLNIIKLFANLNNEPDSPEVQETYKIITQAIVDRKFGKEPEVLTALATSLGKMNITDQTAQQNLAKSVSIGVFGTNTEVLTALATSLGQIKFTYLGAQQTVTQAILNDRFGTDPKTLTALATSLGKMNITDLVAQQNIAEAIMLEKFGADTKVLTALATSLGKMTITDVIAQKKIAKSIIKDKFGTDTKVLTALATSLGTMFRVIAPAAQRDILSAVDKNKFGADTKVLTALAASLGQMRITDITAQTTLGKAIYNNKFGEAPEVLIALATSLGQLRINDSDAQSEIMKAILGNKFGSDAKVLTVLTTSLGKMKISDPDVQQNLATAISQGCFGSNKKAMKKYIFSHQIVAAKIKQMMPELSEDHIFGNLESDLSKSVEAEEDELGAIHGIYNVKGIIDSFFEEEDGEDDQYKGLISGSYGFVYNDQGNPDYLIVMAKKSDESSMTSIREEMQGFLEMTPDMIPVYGHLVQNVKAYKIKETGGYIFVDRNFQIPIEFLPGWLQEATLGQQFELDEYVDKNLLGFALSQTENISDPKLRAITTSAIQRAIMAEGNGTRIGAGLAEDMEIKDRINDAFPYAELLDPTSNTRQQLNSFWATLPDPQAKSKLIFLLGQIAKQGVLGYEHSGQNTSNRFYYLMTLELALKFRAEYPTDSTDKMARELGVLIDALQGGACIEAATFNLLKEFPNIQTIWLKH